ncbi:carbon-nitrogen hydrolase family protein [Bacillus sp. H-16]|uniref:carbon-nitrogen hydrolase family protein n=1 Tax=Alteribacter salitolerans TaxID=2912333 RepID=UPI0019629BC7|nr:carbon-nitrogen hydrolase family protein [Alteribacter salitolerans]MBM7095787.1 carbon-nitrogen hydrolase family protein [Alteribacter salitolerans]
METTSIKIAGCQVTVPHIVSMVERDLHVRNVTGRTREKLRETEVDLVVFPELSTISYSKDTFAHLQELAEELDGPSFKRFSWLAKELGAFVCYGMPLKENGRIFIAQVVLDSGGDYVAHYNKIHLAQFGASLEKQYFSRGDRLVSFTIDRFSFGLMICYDMRFPELARKYALEKEVDCLLHPVAFYKDQSYPSWHHFVHTRALENQVYMLSLNQAGEKYGRSVFCPPWVDYNTEAAIFSEDEEVKVFELSKKTIRKSRDEYRLREDRFF